MQNDRGHTVNDLYEYQSMSLRNLDTLRNRIIKDAQQDKKKYKNHASLLIKTGDLYRLLMVTDAKTLRDSMSNVLSNIQYLKDGLNTKG